MDTKQAQTYKRLSSKERDLIAVWRGGGVTVREIARRLNRSPGTISEEIKRNTFYDKSKKTENEKYYVANWAQTLTDKRKLEARRRNPLKNNKVMPMF